jgi:hypothetical protein
MTRANDWCQKKYGDALAATLKNDGSFNCTCRTGFLWNSGSNLCERQKTREEILAEGTASCRSSYGDRAHVAGQNGDGTFRCQCESGYQFGAGNQCVRARTQAEVIADGTQVCRQQFGPQWYAIRHNPNGTYQCQKPATYTPQPRIQAQQPRIQAQQPRIIQAQRPQNPAPAARSCQQGYVMDKYGRCWSHDAIRRAAAASGAAAGRAIGGSAGATWR